MANLQIKFGKDNAPCKVIAFLSPTCTFCPTFYKKHLPKILSIGGSQIQVVVYPVIRNDVDLNVIGQMGVMGANGQKAFNNFYSVSGKSREDYEEKFRAKFGIERYDVDAKGFKEIAVSALKNTSVCKNNWKIKSTPAVVINGASMSGLDDIKALFKSVQILTKG
jgi:protein-disulfide isomerase